MTSGAKITDIPLDVYEHLFDVVRLNDAQRRKRKRTLFAASHVCKAWGYFTRRARFQALYLVVRLPGEKSLLRYFLDEFVRQPFFEEVRRKRLVKSLTMRWGKDESTSEVDFEDLLPWCLPLFPGLQTLELRGTLRLRAPEPPARRFLLKALKVAGRISRGSSNSFVVTDLLALFPELEYIELEEIPAWVAAPVTRRKIKQIEVEAEDAHRAQPLGVDGEARVDNTYIGDATEPRGIRSAVFTLASPPESLVELLRRGNLVKHLDLTNIHPIDACGLSILEACAPTLEEAYIPLCHARYEEETEIPQPNANLVPLINLHRLSIAVPVTSWRRQDEEDGLLRGEPWASLAAMLTRLYERASTAPKLEYVELLLESRKVGRRERAQEIDFARATFEQHLPFTRCADAELCDLIDAGVAGCARVSFRGRVPYQPYFALEAHSCLNDLIAEAFPMLNAKGRLSLKDSACKCGADLG